MKIWLVLYHLDIDNEQATDTTVAYAYRNREDAIDKMMELTRSHPSRTADGDNQYYDVQEIELN